MDSERQAGSPPSVANMSGISAEASTGAFMFTEASNPTVNGGVLTNLQGDQNAFTFNGCILYVVGSILDALQATLAASEASTSGSDGNTPLDQEQNPILEEPSVFTDSGLSSGEDSSPTEQQGPAEETVGTGTIYNRHMFLEGCGMPLFIPQPSTSHCDAYLRQGVSIGDVGVITPHGDFDRFFNICLPAGHVMNPDVLPKGFCRLDADVRVNAIFAHTPGSHIANPSVRRTGTTFRCSEPEGAILTMPQGACHEDLRRNVHKFRDYLNIHLLSWYEYANVVHGLEIGNRDIRLVIGCDKTASWGIATYLHSQSEDNVTDLSFNVRDEGGHSLYPKYVWDADGMAKDLKVGPEDVELLDPPEIHARTPLRNQCTFIRSLNPALSDNEWKQHQLKVAASAEARASARPTHRNILASVLGAIMSLPGRLGLLRGQGTFAVTDSIAPAQTLADHPATPILDMLLQKCPRARVVVVNDRDWCSVIQVSDKDWLTTAQDLPRRIQEAFDIVEDKNGTVYLEKKTKSSQQPHSSFQISVTPEDDDPLSLGDRKLGTSQLFDSLETSNHVGYADARVFRAPVTSGHGMGWSFVARLVTVGLRGSSCRNSHSRQSRLTSRFVIKDSNLPSMFTTHLETPDRTF